MSNTPEEPTVPREALQGLCDMITEWKKANNVCCLTVSHKGQAGQMEIDYELLATAVYEKKEEVP